MTETWARLLSLLALVLVARVVGRRDLPLSPVVICFGSWCLQGRSQKKSVSVSLKLGLGFRLYPQLRVTLETAARHASRQFPAAATIDGLWLLSLVLHA